VIAGPPAPTVDTNVQSGPLFDASRFVGILSRGATRDSSVAPASYAPSVDRDELIRFYPVLFHLADDGAWLSLRTHGLLSTRAIVDLFDPDEQTRAAVLDRVRTRSTVLEHPRYGTAVIRDQGPLKFLGQCLTEGTTVQQYLDALNGRVYFWLNFDRLKVLLGAARYRNKPATVIHVDTARLMASHSDHVQLAPYNTGSMHVPNAPRRGVDVFVDVDRYPHDQWRAKRARTT
jgi:hypothetical protein